MSELSVLTFRLGVQEYALAIEEIVEVAAMVEVTHLADTALYPEIVGMVNRHGVPLLLLDLRRMLQIEAAPLNAATPFIVASYKGRLVGLVVDEVQQVEYLQSFLPSTGPHLRGVVSESRTRLMQIFSLESLLRTHLPHEFEV